MFKTIFTLSLITLFQSVNFEDAFRKGDYCNNVTNKLPQYGIIVGLLPLEGNAVYSTKSHQVTVVGSSDINHLTILYIGTDNGFVIQVRQKYISDCFCYIIQHKHDYSLPNLKYSN